ncbi:hypothetical protein [Micromonospora humida]|uniref:Uncharacterized protein n=1 Tax=Micromonospora humida TaxID=2809018 RepID=A0ABS2IPI2_9ACTN|nr:hypothetical protein [Micromonospora humida]MBM7076238.1 hypothetical protein [Micromonospora humida]
MDANSVTAISATVIAVASLCVSIMETRANRRHHHHSVRPLLAFDCFRRSGQLAGIRVRNCGLGPAIIRSTTFYLDGDEVGPWEKPTVDPLRDTFGKWPDFTSLRRDVPIPVGQEIVLFAVDDYEPARDADLWRAVTHRIRIRVRYGSVYGDERHEAWFEGSPGHEWEPAVAGRHPDQDDHDERH